MKDFDLLSIDGRLLSIFVTVFKTMSVTETAHIFGVTQSTISHSLDKLRNCIGDPLFVKSGRRITPTQKAIEIYPIAQVIIAQIEGLKSSQNFNPEKETKPYTIASNVTETLVELLDFRDIVEALSPKAGIRLLELGSRWNTGEILEDPSTDLAIVVRGRKSEPFLESELLFKDRPVVFFDSTTRNPVHTLEDYATARHGVLDFGGASKSLVEQTLEQHGITRKISISTPTSFTLSRLLLGTNVIATMQSRLAKSVFSEFESCPVPFDVATFKFDMIWHKRSQYTGRNIWLRKVMSQLFEGYKSPRCGLPTH